MNKKNATYPLVKRYLCLLPQGLTHTPIKPNRHTENTIHCKTASFSTTNRPSYHGGPSIDHETTLSNVEEMKSCKVPCLARTEQVPELSTTENQQAYGEGLLCGFFGWLV